MATVGRPNILFLFPDQHRWDYFEDDPGSPVRMPNMARLAERGTRFHQAIVNSPLCAPSRACLASGRSYRRTTVLNNSQDYPLDLPTFYQGLRTAGYRVGGVGKFDLHKNTPGWGLDGKRCLDEWGFTDGIDNEGKWDLIRNCADAPKGPYSRYLHNHDLMEAHLSDFIKRVHSENHENYGYTDPTPLPDKAYSDNWLTENGLAALREFPTDAPWFLQVNFTGPHEPNDITQRMHDLWQGVDFPNAYQNSQHDHDFHNRVRQNYAAILENIDRNCQRLIDAVASRGELENTLIVYSSDHGEMLGDHNLWGKTHPNQASIAVPLIVAGPGVGQGLRSNALVNLIDLAATFLDFGQAQQLPESDAISLRPSLEGTSAEHRNAVFSGMTLPPRAWQGTALGALQQDWDLVWDGRYKLVRHGDGKLLLFDLESDPQEESNLVEAVPTEADRLHSALLGELSRIGRDS